MTMKLFVDNFPDYMDASQLRSLFKSSGKISGITVGRDKISAHIEMETTKGGQKAIEMFHEMQMDGYIIGVEEVQ